MSRRMRSPRKGLLALGGGGSVFLLFLLAMLDLKMNTSVTGLATTAILLPFVNLPPTDTGKERAPSAPVALHIGNSWKAGEPHDVDTSVSCVTRNAAGDRTVRVWYAHRSDKWLDLQRDDLGGPSVLNLEIVQSNSEVEKVPPNTSCRINLHLYHSHGGKFPIEGRVTVVVNKDSPEEELAADVPYELRFPGEERTAALLVWGPTGRLMREVTETFPAAATVPIVTRR